MYGVEGKMVKSFPPAPVLPSPPPPPRELMWELPDELKGEVHFARREFEGACDGYSLDMINFQDFGKNACKVGFFMVLVRDVAGVLRAVLPIVT